MHEADEYSTRTMLKLAKYMDKYKAYRIARIWMRIVHEHQAEKARLQRWGERNIEAEKTKSVLFAFNAFVQNAHVQRSLRKVDNLAGHVEYMQEQRLQVTESARAHSYYLLIIEVSGYRK